MSFDPDSKWSGFIVTGCILLLAFALWLIGKLL